MLSRLKFDIQGLFEEIYNEKFPRYVFTREGITFADLQSAGLQSILPIVNKLRENGRSDEYIRSHVFAFIENDVYLNYVLVKYPNLPVTFNIYKESIDMKFDVIVGNPPFQHATNKRWKLWVSFLEKSVTLLKDDGHTCLVTPIAWLDGLGSELIRAKDVIESNNLLVFNNNVNSYFNGISEKIGYTIIQKRGYENSTTFINNGEKSVLNFKLRKKSVKEIITEKVFSKENKIQTKNFLSNKKPDINSGKCSLTHREEYPVKVIHSGSQTLYYQNSENFDKYMGWKVIVNMSGKYYSQDREYIYVTNTDIPGRNVVGVYVDSEEIGYKVKQLLTSKLYRFVVDSNKTSGFNSSFLNLPEITEELININDSDSLYKHFSLTEDEINFIESNVN